MTRKAGVEAVVNGPLFSLLCDYIKAPSTSQIVSNKLFSRLLQCSEADVTERLHLGSPAERLKDVTDQVFCGGFKLEAGSLLLSSQALHPAITTLNNAVVYIRSMTSK